MKGNRRKWLSGFLATVILVLTVLTGCGNAEAAAKKKEAYEKLQIISMQSTSELTYMMLAWDFTNKSPDFREYGTERAIEANELIQSYYGNFKNDMSALGVTVKDEDVLDALKEMMGDRDNLYEDEDRSKGIAKDLIGAFLATDEKASVSVAKYLFEKEDPLGYGFDYKGMMEEVSVLLSELGEIKEDEEYRKLKDMYETLETVIDDIDKVPDGSESKYMEDLETCREKSLSLAEVFGKKEEK